MLIRINWSDIDLLGHINNVTFFKYMQRLVYNYAMRAD